MLSRLSINLGQRLVLTSNRISPKVTKFVAITSVRHQSTIDTEPHHTASILDISQDAPKVSEVAENVLKFHANGEPTLESIGLGGYSPVGLIQKSLEMMHVYCDMPWWLTVITGTIIIRLLIFPIIIKGQKDGAKMKLYMPIITQLNSKRTACKDMHEAEKYAKEIQEFIKAKGINLPKFLAVTLAPVPVFISMFFGLRGMASTPVESLKEGGCWWFQDLTTSDPFCILPVLNCLTIYLCLQRSLSSGTLIIPKEAKYFLLAIPVIVCPFLLRLEGIMLCYFITTNIFTLIQIELLQRKQVRTYLGLPDLEKTDLTAVLINALPNAQNINKPPETQSAETISFNKTARGPTKDTFNPLENPLSKIQIKTKKR